MHFSIFRLFAIVILKIFIPTFFVTSQLERLNQTGIGATFPLDIYQSWMSYYGSSRFGYVDIRQKYNARGSEAGLTAMVQTLSYGTPNQSPFLVESLLPDFGTSELPYTDKEALNYTDLVTFPVLAGNLVLAYNVPEVENLVLTLDHVVGIYNGTFKFWNESTFADLNDKETFPNASIKPVARYFTSGSTYIFTKALATFSSAFKKTYGSFANRSGWLTTTNFEFGQKSAGMVDTIFNLPYSIGYVPVWLAESSHMSYASLVNRNGEIVCPKSIKHILNSVQENKLKLLSSKYFTSDLVESSQSNYPITGYSYMIVKLTSVVSCLDAVELMRFIKWISISTEANSLANSFYMVSVSSGLVEEIDFRVLKRMTCGKKLVQDLLEQQMSEEEEKKKTWKTPLGISIPICLLIIAGIGFGVWRQRKKYLEMIDKNEWNINAFEIEFNIEKHIGAKFRPSQVNASLDGFRPAAPQQNASKFKCAQKMFSSNGSLIGKYNEIKMCFTPLWLEGYFDTNIKVRLVLTRMRSSIDHTNLLRFYGLTWMNDRMYLAEEHGEKGLLIDVLRHSKFQLSNDFRYAITRDIASGMSYLHRKDVVHGFLTTDSCVVDSRWTVKVRYWGYNLLNQTNKLAGRGKTNLNIYDIRRQQLNDVDQKQFEFWTPPEAEMARGKDFHPTKACDSFCFGLVMFKIFTTISLRTVMRQPKASPNGLPPINDGNQDSLDGKTQILVPRLTKAEGVQSLPNKVRVIIGQACIEDPNQRPSFEKLSVMLMAAHNSKYMSTLDNIIESLEFYGSEIETKMEDLGKRLRKTLDEKDNIISQRIPNWAMSQIRMGKEVDCKMCKNLAVIAVEIDLFHIESTIRPSPETEVNNGAQQKFQERKIISCLDSFNSAIEELVDENSWLFKVEQTSNGVLFVAGFNGFSFAQNIGKLIELLWTWLTPMKKNCLEEISGQDYSNQDHIPIPLFIATLHGGSALFGLSKPSGNQANMKFFSYGEVIKTAQRLNASRRQTAGTGCDRILSTDVIVKNLPMSLKNFKITPAKIYCEISAEMPLYWIEKESEIKHAKIPDVVC